MCEPEEDLSIYNERAPIFRTGKLMILYQLVRSIHETYSPSYFCGWLGVALGLPLAYGHRPQEEFKREAIKLVSEQGLTIAEASRKLDTG